MRAYLKNYRQSPRKVRLVADLIRGKSVEEARLLLTFTEKRATEQLHKLLASAVANAKENDGLVEKDLRVRELRVDKGATLKRMTPRAFGRASTINKRASNITLVLGVQTEPVPATK
jgi:large subunit ribosomal protein L22